MVLVLLTQILHTKCIYMKEMPGDIHSVLRKINISSLLCQPRLCQPSLGFLINLWLGWWEHNMKNGIFFVFSQYNMKYRICQKISVKTIWSNYIINGLNCFINCQQTRSGKFGKICNFSTFSIFFVYFDPSRVIAKSHENVDRPRPANCGYCTL